MLLSSSAKYSQNELGRFWLLFLWATIERKKKAIGEKFNQGEIYLVSQLW